MQKLIILFLVSYFLNCKIENGTSSLKSDLGLFFARSNRLTVSGTAVKGIVKNGSVIINPLNKDGSCNTSRVLSAGTTDSNGDYSLSFFKTGTAVCLTVSGDPNGRTKLFDEKENADVTLSSNSSFKLVTVIPESKITNNSRKNLLASPFSSLLSKRLQTLMKQSGTSPDVGALHKKASKEIAIRFGLSSGLSSAKTMIAPKAVINDSDYPELDDIALDLKNPDNSLTVKNLSILAGLSYIANKTKTGSSTTPDDLANVINAFATDFEDGVFDGKGSDGKPITIGTGASQITLADTPLTTILLPAIASYVQEGGILSAGISGTSTPSVTASQVTSQIQFADNTPIVSATSAGLSYSGSPFSFPQNIAVTPITPAGGGTFTSCTVSPSLPVGLSLNSTTCAISGTPTVWQAPTGYTVSAANSSGNAATTISISVSSDGASWTARSMPSVQNWWSVTYGNNIFVTVPNGGSVAATSPDGITWTARTLPSSSSWASVTYGNGVFVAVVNNSSVAATSPDGITWTARTLPSSSSWKSVTYGNGLFVAVANGPSTVAASSSDGITWTARTLPSSSQWNSVTYGNGVFAAVAYGPSTVAATSTDGISWTARTLPTSSQWQSVTYGNGVFVAVTTGPSTAAASSPDGITWSARTLPSSQTWVSVVYGNGVFTTVAYSSSNAAATSLDGITWTARTLPSSSNWQSIAYGNGVFAAVVYNSALAATSP